MKISVCMATYNGEKYIREQLESILCQIGKEDEVIVSDDSSTDETVNIIKSFNDDRLIILEGQTFQSPTFNFENALKRATGQLIVLSDQDDLWRKDKIDKIKTYINQYDLILSDAEIVDDKLNVVYESFFEINGSKQGLINNLVKNSYMGCTMAFNRNILEKALPFPKDTPMHDVWIGLIAEVYGKILFIDEKLISHRRHGGNASVTSEKSNNSIFKKIFFRLVLIKNLCIRLLTNLLNIKR